MFTSIAWDDRSCRAFPREPTQETVLRRAVPLLALLSLSALPGCGGAEVTPLIGGGTETTWALHRVGPDCLPDDAPAWAVLLAETGSGCVPGTGRQIWVSWGQAEGGVVTVPSTVSSDTDPTVTALDCPSGGLCREADRVRVDITSWTDGVSATGTLTLTFGGFDTVLPFGGSWCDLAGPCG